MMFIFVVVVLFLLVNTVQMQIGMGSVPEAWLPMATPTMDFLKNFFFFPNLSLTDLSMVAGQMTVKARVSALALGLQACVLSCLHSKQLLPRKDLSILLS